MRRKNIIWGVILALLTFAAPAFSGSTSRRYYGYTTEDSPLGSGYIYIKRGGQADELLLSITSSQWVAAGSTCDAGNINVDKDNDPDGFKVYDPATSNNQSKPVLHMYFYAKPNPGYQFDGWFKEEAGTTPLESSTEHYPLPNPKPSKKTTYSPTRWDNGGTNDQIPSKGEWQDFYFLRYVDDLASSGNVERYARFSIISRQFVLVGTGFADVNYTAVTTTTHNVGSSNVTTEATTSDIALSITYDAEKYVFSGWQWSEGFTGVKGDISTEASATYTLNTNTAAARGLTDATRVHIWPILREKADNVADVIYNGETTQYESWEDGLAAAKAVSGATLRLKKDVTDLDAVQTINTSMILDLNGHTISGTISNLFTVSGTGTVFTITDNTPAQAGRLETTVSDVQNSYAVTVASGASLVMQAGTVYSNNTKSDGSARSIEILSGASLSMTGGKAEAQSLQNAYAVINRGTATINGGTLYAHTTTAATAVGFYNVGTSATINGGSFQASSATTTAYGIQNNVNKTLTINNAVVLANASIGTAYALARSNGVIVVNDGKFNAVAPSTVASVNVANKSQVTLRGGVYRTYNNVRQCAAAGYDCYELEAGADYDAGYRFQVTAADAHPRVCKVIEIGKTTYYESLEDALAYANNNPNTLMSIIMIAFEYTLPAGNYTLPNQASLIVPKNVDQTGASLTVDRVDSYATPSLFRKLTFASGVRMDVFGTIEAGGTQNSNGQGHNGAGVPSGAYGQIELQAGSKVILNNGSRLNAWGFVTGAGEIDARRGSQVYEQFQMFDWKGGKNAGGMLNNTKKVFPVNQYYIQNVEAPTTFHPGSALTAMTSIYVSGSRINCDVVKIVGVTGSGAMFLMDEMDDSENTWVRKYYDVENDKQVYAVNSSAHLGSMIINMEGVPVIGDLNFDSRNYTLPITSNLKIHLLDGYMDITQSTVMIPGAEIEIDKTSTVTINSGQSLYLYDAAEWNKYVFSSAYAQPVLYTPSAPLVNNRRTPTARPGSWVNSSGWWYTLEKPASASINVHGTFDVQGALYTTESGANIFSTNEDAGTVYFSKNAPEDDKVSQPISYTDGTITNTPVYEDKTCVSAKLKNEDGYTTTKGVAKTGDSYCYIQDAWRNLKTDGCFVYETTEEGIIYYAKPSDYVALANGKEENADHTYSSADKSRTFILVGDCQWWEVTYLEESGLYYCAKNDTYYFYDDSDPEPEFHEWKEKVFSVTWLNWNGVQIEKYNNIRYGSMPNYLGSTPKREKDDYYTYDYSAWSPALSPVISDVTYTAQYERKDRKYTITWKDESGNTIVADYFSMGQIPACSKTVDLTGKEWNPAVSAVTGDAAYQLKEKNVNGPFDIKFFNWDGAQIGTTQSVAKNTIPTLPASSPIKPAIADVRFIFTGWSPEVVPATANASYTAMFEEQPVTYAIRWQNYDNSEIKTDNVTPNTVPQYTGTTPTKPEDANNSYVFNGWNPTIGAATGDAIYTATYTAVPKDMEVSTSQTLPASSITTVSNMIVHPSGTLTVPNTATLKAANLILEATGNTSGQVIVNPGYESRLQIAGTAYFDLTLNTPARHWHAFGVPWRVDINAAPLKEVETGRTLTLGRDYDIIYYNGTKRASDGPGAHCWEYVEDNGKTLTPGQGYMIAFTSAVQTVRFTKAAGAPIIFNGSNSVTGGTGDNGGWNAIANPMAYHATLNAGPTVGYVHDGGEIGSDGYVPYDIENKKYIVGKAVYVQASAPATVAVAAAGNKGVITPVAAPARRTKATDQTYLAMEDYYRVSLADVAGVTGNVYVLNEEDKADQYVIGHDLSQFGMNATKPQVWVNRYGTKLALNTTAPIDGVAEFPVSLYAPKDGEYTISIQPSAVSEQEETLYLTKDGEVIWNLSDGAYTTVLNKGVITGYTLRLGEKKAPEVATGFGEAVVDAQGKTTKVLIDGKVFIIREDRVYTIDGQLVK